MIRTDREYQEKLDQLKQLRELLRYQRQTLREAQLSLEQIETTLLPTVSQQEQLAEQILQYERIKKREFDSAYELSNLPKLLIALRIAGGISQKELAGRLGVSEAQVSRDERNEYQGITIDRAQRVLDALNGRIVCHIAHSPSHMQGKTEEERAEMSQQLTEIAQSLCRLHGWQVGEAWVPDERGETLVCATQVFTDDLDISEFQGTSMQARLEKGIGLEGLAWSANRTEIVSDLKESKEFSRSTAALKAGLKRALAFPLRKGGEVIAVLVFLSSAQQDIDSDLLKSLDKLGSHLGNDFKRAPRRNRRSMRTKPGLHAP